MHGGAAVRVCRGLESKGLASLEDRGEHLIRGRSDRQRWWAVAAGPVLPEPSRAGVRTSATDPLRVDWVAGFSVGAIGITMAPGRRGRGPHTGVDWQRNLTLDLERLRYVEQADVLVTLMEPDELARFSIATLPARARAIGLRWRGLPIRDGGVPSSDVELLDLLLQLRAEEGARVVVHCLGGLGRSGLVVGCLLAELGWSAESALEALRRARGPLCPETPAQVEYVRAWASRRGAGRRGKGVAPEPHRGQAGGHEARPAYRTRTGLAGNGIPG